MAAARLPRAARHAAAVRSVHGAAGASRIFVPPAAVMQTQRITLLHHTAAPPFTAHARQRYRLCSTAASASGGPAGAVPWLAGLQAWPAKSMPAVGSGSGNGSNGVEKLSSQQQQQQQQQVVALDPAGVSSLPPVDAIMVLAGGLLRDGGLPLWVARRLDVAHGLHVLQQHRPPVVCLGGGTPHKPDVLMPSGHVLHESTACSRYLLDQGMSPHAILKDTASFDTVGNAYFGLTTHTVPAGWTRVAVVTSAFHMPRSAALFADMYRIAGESVFGDQHRFTLYFLSASDEGVFEPDVYAARTAKEADSLTHWRGVAGRVNSMQQLHAWLHEEHLCYAVPRQHEWGRRTIEDPKLLASY